MDGELNKKKFNPIVIMLTIAVVILLGVAMVFGRKYIQALNSDNGLKTDPNVFMNDEDAEKFLKDKVANIRIDMNQVVHCHRNEEGKQVASVGLLNRNPHQYYVQFILADTGEVVYITGLIPPNGTLEEIPVETEKELEPGTYPINIIFSAISEADNETNLGSCGININMVVDE